MSEAVFQFAVPDIDAVRSREEILAKCLAQNRATGWLSQNRQAVIIADGRVFLWFQSPQKIGDIRRREFSPMTDGFDGAICFRIARKADFKREVLPMAGNLASPKYWYAVEVD